MHSCPRYQTLLWWPLAALAVSLAAIIRWVVMDESLWVDELHSAWTISGGGLSEKAVVGNQTTLYYRLLQLWANTFGCSEISLRTPSLLATLSMIFGVGWILNHQRWPIFVSFGMMATFAIDRVQLFYAVEARPYAIVQALTILLILVDLIESKALSREPQDLPSGSVDGAKKERQPNWMTTWLPVSGLTWVMVSVGLLYLHYTAILLVAASWLGRCCGILIHWRFSQGQLSHSASSVDWRRDFIRIIIQAIIVGVVSLPLLAGSADVLERREQWSSFAGGAAIGDWYKMFPWLWLLALPTVAAIAATVMSKSSAAHQLACSGDSNLRLLIHVGCVGLLPSIFAWALTALEIAPLMHRRYVIGCQAFLYIYAGISLGLAFQRMVQLPTSRRVVRMISILGCLLLFVSGLFWWQGWPKVWASGRVVGYQRLENWSAAVQWVKENRLANQTAYVAPSLIEGNDIESEISEELSNYLLFPVRSIYPVDSPVVPLAKLDRQWAWTFDQSLDDESDNNLDRELVWVIARMNADKFTRQMSSTIRLLSARDIKLRVIRWKSFGNVCAAEIGISNISGPPR